MVLDTKVSELKKEEQEELERLKRVARMCKGVLSQMVRKLSGMGYFRGSNQIHLDSTTLNTRFAQLAGIDVKQYYREYMQQRKSNHY